MQDYLPLALVEEQAERQIGAEECGNDGKGDGFDQPRWTYDLMRCAVGCGASVWLGCGAGHWGILYRL
jgi:hypothetical protein